MTLVYIRPGTPGADTAPEGTSVADWDRYFYQQKFVVISHEPCSNAPRARPFVVTHFHRTLERLAHTVVSRQSSLAAAVYAAQEAARGDLERHFTATRRVLATSIPYLAGEQPCTH